jgi:hypothetical protein
MGTGGSGLARIRALNRSSRPRTIASAGRDPPSAMRKPMGVVRKQPVAARACWLRTFCRFAIRVLSRGGFF